MAWTWLYNNMVVIYVVPFMCWGYPMRTPRRLCSCTVSKASQVDCASGLTKLTLLVLKAFNVPCACLPHVDADRLTGSAEAAMYAACITCASSSLWPPLA